VPENPLGISSFVLASPFGDENLSVFSSVREMGYDMVELCIEDPSRLSAARVKEAAAQAGLALTIGGAFGEHRDLSHESPHRRQAGLDYLLQCVSFAAAVEARIVSGPMYSAAGKARMLSPDERAAQRQWAVEGIRVAADRAGEHGIVLAVEPLNRFETDLVNTVQQGIELCDLVDRANVGLALDTFHMNIEEKHVGEAIRIAGPLIVNFQASENDRGAPGSGHIDWRETFDALKEIDYGGPIVVESFRPEVADLAAAVFLWRPVVTSMDDLARDSYHFIREEIQRSEGGHDDHKGLGYRRRAQLLV